MPDSYQTTTKCIENLFPPSSTNIRYIEGIRHADIPGLTVVFTTNGFTCCTTAEAYYAKSTIRDGKQLDRTIHLFSSLPVSDTPSEADDETLLVPGCDVEKQDEITRHLFLRDLYQICSDMSEVAMSDQSRKAWTSLLSDQGLVPGRYLGHACPPSQGTAEQRIGWIERIRNHHENQNWSKKSAKKNEVCLCSITSQQQ